MFNMLEFWRRALYGFSCEWLAYCSFMPRDFVLSMRSIISKHIEHKYSQCPLPRVVTKSVVDMGHPPIEMQSVLRPYG